MRCKQAGEPRNLWDNSGAIRRGVSGEPSHASSSDHIIQRFTLVPIAGAFGVGGNREGQLAGRVVEKLRGAAEA